MTIAGFKVFDNKSINKKCQLKIIANIGFTRFS